MDSIDGKFQESKEEMKAIYLEKTRLEGEL